MKLNQNRYKLLAGMAVAGMLALFTAWASPIGQSTFTAASTFASINTTTVTSTNSTVVPVTANAGLTFFPVLTTSSNTVTAANVVFGFNGSPDGVIWTTVLPLTYTNSTAGTNIVTGNITFTATQLSPYRFIRLDSVQSAAATTITTVSNTVPYVSFY